MTTTLTASAPANPVDPARPWTDASLPASKRAELLLAAMTITEKVAQLGSFWDDRRSGDEIIAPMQDILSAGKGTFETVTRNGIGHLTRVLGTHPAVAADGAERLSIAQRKVVAASRLGIPAIAHEECLTGFTTLGATVYPTSLAWAATFNPGLVEEMAAAIGTDMRSVGVHQGLSPVLDVVRDYRWGRVEETMGEDPYLVSTLGTAYVRGLESTGIVATLKHFAGYAASRGGRNHAPVSMGPRELADMILPPFEMAVRVGGARSVMNSYTDIDGVPVAANHAMLTTLLREKWGFTGTVVSDYWAIAFLKSKHLVAETVLDAAVLALTAGLDVELPNTTAYGRLEEALSIGALEEADIDRSALRVLTQKAELGLLDADWTPDAPDGIDTVDLDRASNRAVAKRIADESVILLANSKGLLPLSGKIDRIAMVGPCVNDARAFLGCYSYPIHVLPRHPELGLGLEIETLPEAIAAALPNSAVSAIEGCPLSDIDRTGIPAAVEAARNADLVIAVVGDRAGMFNKGTSGEGSDAPSLALPGVQGELLDALLETGRPVLVIVLSGRPYALGEYADRAAGIVQSFMPGVEGASAIADVLVGAVNPSGKLPVQVPRTPAALPHTYLAPPLGLDGDRISNISIAPQFAFGHGLSYTRFDYSELRLSAERIPVDGSIEASVTVTNSGQRDGATVAQLYLTDPVAQVTRPVIQLVGFARLSLAAGQSARVSFQLDADRFSFTGRDNERIVEPGTIVLSVGESSTDRGLSASFVLEGAQRTVGRDYVMTTPVRVEKMA
jgi:beta-glucosidase